MNDATTRLGQPTHDWATSLSLSIPGPNFSWLDGPKAEAIVHYNQAINILASDGATTYNAQFTHEWMNDEKQVHTYIYMQSQNKFEGSLPGYTVLDYSPSPAISICVCVSTHNWWVESQ